MNKREVEIQEMKDTIYEVKNSTVLSEETKKEMLSFMNRVLELYLKK